MVSNYHETDDNDLVKKALAGYTEAYDEIICRYQHRLYTVVYRILGNHEDTLDLCQEVFVRAYHSLSTFRGNARVYTWLYSIAANLARNKLRDTHRKGRDQGVSMEALQETGSAPESGQATPRDQAQARETAASLQECLDKLPDHYRMAFVLRVVDDLNYSDIALSLGCPDGTVKSRLSQARKLLHQCLKDHQVL